VLALISVPFVLLARVLGGVMMGAEDFWSFNVGSAAVAAAPLVALIITLVILHLGVAAAVLSTTIAAFLAGLGWLAWAIHKSGGIRWRLDRDFVRAAGTYGAQMHAANILTFLGYRLDVFLVNGFMNPAAVGFYSIAAATAERVFTVAEAAATVLFPRAAAQDARSRDLTTPVVARNVFWTSAIIGGAIFALANWLVPLFYSDTFEPSIRPMRILIVGIVVATPARVLQNAISARGRPILNSYVAAVSVAVNLAGNVLLIPSHGISGAAWASVISYSLYSVLTVAVYCAVSDNSLLSVLLPRRADLVLLRRAASGLVRSPRA
jgi:O-antigen/teichoic acid export membrane protein